jgi:hypothetical protein
MAKQLHRHARWRHRRQLHLSENPLCVMCLREGRVVPAEVVDHVEPWRDSENPERAFFESPIQGLCRHHHDSDKQRQEKSGGVAFSTTIGVDGYPLDPDHPWHRGRL